VGEVAGRGRPSSSLHRREVRARRGDDGAGDCAARRRAGERRAGRRGSGR
ncbi:MAG: hypothetical protein AVDCRST_MAG52-500, partial [uncultured Blastococcus sp.]